MTRAALLVCLSTACAATRPLPSAWDQRLKVPPQVVEEAVLPWPLAAVRLAAAEEMVDRKYQLLDSAAPYALIAAEKVHAYSVCADGPFDPRLHPCSPYALGCHRGEQVSSLAIALDEASGATRIRVFRRAYAYNDDEGCDFRPEAEKPSLGPEPSFIEWVRRRLEKSR